jgi:archaellum component FlaC
MEWIQALTIIASLVVFISIVANLLNKRIDDLRQDINRRLDKIEENIREIRQLFYKFFEIPKKEGE